MHCENVSSGDVRALTQSPLLNVHIIQTGNETREVSEGKRGDESNRHENEMRGRMQIGSINGMGPRMTAMYIRDRRGRKTRQMEVFRCSETGTHEGNRQTQSGVSEKDECGFRCTQVLYLSVIFESRIDKQCKGRNQEERKQVSF